MSSRMEKGHVLIPPMLPLVSSKIAIGLGLPSRIPETAVLTKSLGGRAEGRRREMIL